jgi:hypothetical protein
MPTTNQWNHREEKKDEEEGEEMSGIDWLILIVGLGLFNWCYGMMIERDMSNPLAHPVDYSPSIEHVEEKRKQKAVPLLLTYDKNNEEGKK